MKNKILKKILLVVICVSVLVSVLVIPSFAYTWKNPTAYNNDVGSFNLPYSYIDLKLNENLFTGYDLPDHVKLSTTSTHSLTRPNSVGNGSLSYNLPDGRTSNLSFTTNVYNSTVYDTSYYYGGYFDIVSSYSALQYRNMYYIDAINYGDVWISDIELHNYQNTIYNSLQLAFFASNLYEVDGRNNILAEYTIDFITPDGELKREEGIGQYLTVDIKLEQDDPLISGAYYFVTVPYLPTDFSNQYGDVVYIVNSNIQLWTPGNVKPDLFLPASENSNNVQATSFFINRCRPSSEFTSENYENLKQTIFDRGFIDGYNQGINYDLDPFGVIFGGVDSFLNWEFIPGISFGIILTIMIAVFLIIAFLKFFAGG